MHDFFNYVIDNAREPTQNMRKNMSNNELEVAHMWTINVSENKLNYKYDHSLPNFIDGLTEIEIDNLRKQTLKIRCKVNTFDKQRILQELNIANKENDVLQLDVSQHDIEKYLQLFKAQLKSRSAQTVVTSLFKAFNLSVTPTPMPLITFSDIPLHEKSEWCRQETTQGLVYYHIEKKNTLPHLIVTQDNQQQPQQLTVDFSNFAANEKRAQFENLAALIKMEDKELNVHASFPFMHFSLAGKNQTFYLEKIAQTLGLHVQAQSSVLAKLHEDIKPKNVENAKSKEQKLLAPGALGAFSPPPKKSAPEPAPKQSRRRAKK